MLFGGVGEWCWWVVYTLLCYEDSRCSVVMVTLHLAVGIDVQGAAVSEQVPFMRVYGL
jgi:hypothetical protein